MLQTQRRRLAHWPNNRARLRALRLEDRTVPATIGWVGDVSGLWGANVGGNTNWANLTTLTDNVLPHNGDDLVFPTMNLNHTQTNNLTNLIPGSISFSDTDYVISGNAITVDSITDTSSSGHNTLNLPIAGPITVAVNAASTRLTLGGVISGSGALTKNGNGILRLSGASANTYTGLTTVSDGTLELGKNTLVISVPENLTINSGGTARELSASQIANTSTVTVSAGGTFDLNDFSDTIGPLTVNGGSVTIGLGTLFAGLVTMTGGSIAATGAGKLVLQNDVITSGASASAIISGNLDLGSTTRAFTIGDGTAAADLDITAIIQHGGLTKDGPGTMRLSGSASNSYVGLTTVTLGTLELNKSGGAIAMASGLTINGGVARELVANQISDTAPITVNAPGAFDLNNLHEDISSLNVNGGNVTIGTGELLAGPVIMSGGSIASSGIGLLLLVGDLITGGASTTATISGKLNIDELASGTCNVADGPAVVDLDISAVISESTLHKTGGGALQFSGSSANTNNGVTVSQGTLDLIKTNGAVAVAGSLTVNGGAVLELLSNQIADTSAVTVTAGQFTLSQVSDTIGALSVAGGTVSIIANTLSAGTVIMTGSSISGTMGGTLRLQSNVITNQASTAAVITANLDLGGATRTFNIADGGATDDLQILGVISGSVGEGLTKTGAGALRLGAILADNSFTGLTTVSAGTLALSCNGVVALAGNLTINGGTVLESFGGQIANTSTVTVSNGGLLDLNNLSDTIGHLTVDASVVTGTGVTIGTGTLTVGSLDMTGGSIVSTGAGKLVLQGDVTAASTSTAATISGNLDLGNTTRTFNVDIGTAAVDLDISAVISGTDSAGLTKDLNGTLRLDGSASNTYPGATNVVDGTLELGKSGGTLAVPGNLTTNLFSTAREVVGNQIADTSTVSVNGSFDLNGQTDTVGALTVSFGSVTIGTGTLMAGSVTMTSGNITSAGTGKLVLQGNVTANAATSTATINGNLDLGGATRTFTVADSAVANPDLNITAVISSGALTKDGAGTLQLSGPQANTYTGATTVSAGTLELAKTSLNGTVLGDLTINGGTARNLAINQIANTSAVTVGAGGTFDVNNVISEIIGVLTVSGGNMTIGTGVLTTGTVTMTGGSIASSGTGELLLQGSVVTNSASSAATIIGNIDLGGATRTFTVADGPADPDLVIGAVISNGNVQKSGVGTLDYAGSSSNTYGSTTVSAGTLRLAKLAAAAVPGSLTINGGTVLEIGSNQIADTSNVSVNTGGTFDLHGVADTVGALTVVGGTLTNGAAFAGRLTAGNTSFNSTSTLAMRLVDAATSDRITVNGMLTVGGTLALNPTQALPIGTAITLIDNDGSDPVTGTFANLPQGATLLAGGQLFRISYTGGNGNDVVLTRTGGPSVLSTQVNDGSAQRSRVTSVSVTFSAQVTFAGTIANAFTLARTGGGAVTFAASASVVNGVTVVTLDSFTGAETEFGSLKDGRYTLTALAGQITFGGQQLDGNGDGTTGDNYTFGEAQGLFRFYGDINGDRHVDIADFGLFSQSIFNTANYIAAFDFNNDGHIDIADFGQFSNRIFTMLP
jgi:autotransporter-associated beta strand protein